MKIELPYPAAPLWPNKRSHWAKKHTATKKARGDAYSLAGAATSPIYTDTPIAVKITVGGKPKGPLPDRDNCIAAAKAYLDGIADAIGINDRDFDAPKVVFSSVRNSTFVIEIGDRPVNVTDKTVNAAWDKAMGG